MTFPALNSGRKLQKLQNCTRKKTQFMRTKQVIGNWLQHGPVSRFIFAATNGFKKSIVAEHTYNNAIFKIRLNNFIFSVNILLYLDLCLEGRTYSFCYTSLRRFQAVFINVIAFAGFVAFPC